MQASKNAFLKMKPVLDDYHVLSNLPQKTTATTATKLYFLGCHSELKTLYACSIRLLYVTAIISMCHVFIFPS